MKECGRSVAIGWKMLAEGRSREIEARIVENDKVEMVVVGGSIKVLIKGALVGIPVKFRLVTIVPCPPED